MLTSPLTVRMAETLSLRGVLKGHDGWVTCIATSSELPDKILSGGRDKVSWLV